MAVSAGPERGGGRKKKVGKVGTVYGRIALSKDQNGIEARSSVNKCRVQYSIHDAGPAQLRSTPPGEKEKKKIVHATSRFEHRKQQPVVCLGVVCLLWYIGQK